MPSIAAAFGTANSRGSPSKMLFSNYFTSLALGSVIIGDTAAPAEEHLSVLQLSKQMPPRNGRYDSRCDLTPRYGLATGGNAVVMRVH